ncbi:hypothetical protein K488DRAFT_73448 [Vararia minispora EC-137]|uniref:Uncharacterized protein n=1 Tax=Vararia minispora EC-137 TaxID=1314806 RepID=A0ACB8QAY2_9AGAM|nr:hypothetical protein K488DRAFT_73448 [Vararia minispora EC-137]
MASSPSLARPTENPIQLDLSNTLGCVLIGVCLSLVLYGVGSMQAILVGRIMILIPNVKLRERSCETEDDGRWALVGLPAFTRWDKHAMAQIDRAMSTAHEALGFTYLWTALIQDYGGIQKLSKLSRHVSLREARLSTLIAHPAGQLQNWLQTLVTSIVELYFIHRVWRFALRRYSSAFLALVVLALWHPACYTYLLFAGFDQPASLLSTPFILGLGISALAAEVVVDVSIVTGLLALLSAHYPLTPSSRVVVYRLQLIVVNTGLFTVLLATCALFFYAWRPHVFLYRPFYTSFSSSYFCCLLTNLNTRRFDAGLILVPEAV